MANIWVNRVTVEPISGVDAAGMAERFGSSVDFNTYANNAEWLYDPDLSAVTGQPTKYWFITGDNVTLITLGARNTVDAAEDEARLDSIADQLDQTQTILKAFAQVMLDEINNLRSEHGLNARTLAQLKSAVRGKL